MRNKNRRIAFLLILVLILHCSAVQPAYAELTEYVSGYEKGVFDPVYFGPLLFVCDFLSYKDGETSIGYQVYNMESQPYRGDFEIYLCDSDHNVIAKISKEIELSAGQDRGWGQELEGDLSSATEWYVSEKSSKTLHNEAEELTIPHIVDKSLRLDHIQIYKTAYDYWVFECDVEKLRGEEQEIPERSEIEFLFQNQQGQEIMKQPVVLHMKGFSTHLAFYTRTDLSEAHSFESIWRLPSDSWKSPATAVIRNKNNLGANGRYLGTAQLGELYFQDIMLVDSLILTGKVTNRGKNTEKGLFRFCFYKDKKCIATILSYAGDTISPGQSKNIYTKASKVLTEADTIFIMDAEEFGAERSGDLLEKDNQPFPDEYHLSPDWTYYSAFYSFRFGVKFHSLKYQDGSTEFAYSFMDSDMQKPFEGKVEFSFYRDDICLGMLTNDIRLTECLNCKEYPGDSNYHFYIQTIHTDQDLSDADKILISFEGEDQVLKIVCNDGAEVISPKQFESGIQIDEIHIYDQFEVTCLRYHIRNNGKWFEKKNLLFAFVDEKGNVYSDDSTSAYFFYHGREAWKEKYFYESLNIQKLIVVVSEPGDYATFDKYAETTLPVNPSPVQTPTPTLVPTPVPTADPNTNVTSSTPAAQTNKPVMSAQPSPAVTFSSEKKVSVQTSVKRKKLVKPKIRVTTKKYKKKMRIAIVRLKKYQGTHIQIYYRRGKGRYKRIRLRQSNIKRNKKIFKIGYTKGRKKIYVRVRTYQKKGGKKQYSPYSKSWRVR